MNKQSVYVSQMPAGCERAGAARGTEQAMLMPAHIQTGTELAPPSGIEYGIKNQCVMMTKIGERCLSPQANGETICLAHQRAKRYNEKKEFVKEVIKTSE